MERNHFEKILQDANFKQDNVISDIFGKGGSNIISALINVTTDFDEFLAMSHGRIKKKQDILKKSLEGKLAEHHKFMLKSIQMSIPVRPMLHKMIFQNG